MRAMSGLEPSPKPRNGGRRSINRSDQWQRVKRALALEAGLLTAQRFWGMGGEEWVASSAKACQRRAQASAMRSTQHSMCAATQQVTFWRRGKADCAVAVCKYPALCDNRIAGYSRAMDLKWLAEQLNRPGYSQAGLARALGKDAAAVNRMLKGEPLIKANQLPAVIGQSAAARPPGRPGPSRRPI